MDTLLSLARHAIHVSVIIACSTNAFAQDTAYPIDRWITALSVKKDVKAVQLRQVLSEVKVLDTEQECAVLDALRTRGPEKHPRFQIRLNILEIFLRANGEPCPDSTPALDLLATALQEAYQLEDDLLIYEIHCAIAPVYKKLNQYGHNVMHSRLAMDMLKHTQEDIFFIPSLLFYDRANGLYHTREYRECIDVSRDLLIPDSAQTMLPDDTLTLQYQLLSWNTLGLAYDKLGIYDSAFIAFNKVRALATILQSHVWLGIVSGNMGDVFYKKGEYDTAQVLLTLDYQQSITDSLFDNAANSLQWLARIDMHHGHHQEALDKLREAKSLLTRTPNDNFLSNVLHGFTQAYINLGNADSANLYMGQYLTLHDAIEKQASDNRAEIIQLRVNNLEHLHAIKALNKEKERITLIRNFVITIILLVALVGYALVARARMKMQLRHLKVLDEKRQAEAKAAHAMDQLHAFREHMLEKTAMIEELQTRLEDRETSEEQTRRISELSSSSILTEEDWDKFRNLFESVYPGFFLALRNTVPDITLAEQRMAALSKLKLTVKESATLLGISTNSVYKTRQRLRLRLGLDQDAELDAYFSEMQGAITPGTRA